MSRHGESPNASRVDLDLFGECPTCGAAKGKQCFSTNGTRKRIPCTARPYTPDAIRARFAEIEELLEVTKKQAHELREMVLKQQRQIDILLGEIES